MARDLISTLLASSIMISEPIKCEHKEHEVSRAVSTPNYHLTAVYNSLGSIRRSSPGTKVTNGQDEACEADIDKRQALSTGVDVSNSTGN